jgi:hypothetical protein
MTKSVQKLSTLKDARERAVNRVQSIPHAGRAVNARGINPAVFTADIHVDCDKVSALFEDLKITLRQR